MTERPHRLAAGLLALLLAGCAAGPPPAPPLAEPVPEGPRQYRWTALRWATGQEYSYRLEAFTETKLADEVTAARSEHGLRLRAGERTTEARTPVSLIVDGAEAAVLVFDGDGRFHDAVPVRPDRLVVARQLVWALMMATRHIAPQILTVDSRLPVPLSAEYVRLLAARPGHPGADALVQALGGSDAMTVEFTGYRQVGARIVIDLRGKLPNFLRSRVTWTEEGMPEWALDYVGAEWTDHFDATTGILMSRYWVLTLGGDASGRRLTRREITVLTFER